MYKEGDTLWYWSTFSTKSTKAVECTYIKMHSQDTAMVENSQGFQVFVTLANLYPTSQSAEAAWIKFRLSLLKKESDQLTLELGNLT